MAIEYKTLKGSSSSGTYTTSRLLLRTPNTLEHFIFDKILRV